MRARLPVQWAFIALALGTTACSESGPAVASNFELAAFQGHWYEIASIPRDYDLLCRDTQADYRQSGALRMEMDHDCVVGPDPKDKLVSHATVSVDDASVPAKLTMQVGSYAGGYWVLDVDDAYSYALVGHPSRTMLWVLSRAPKLDPELWARATAIATQRGFDTATLRKTPQSDAL